jgi:hypothetical protein
VGVIFTARGWKAHYAAEREALGAAGLLRLLERAPAVTLPERGALVFPHTHLASSGELVAAVARAVIRSGRSEVLALGVLHGAREQDRELVHAARAGEARALGLLRGVHGPGLPGEHAAEEFSLDGFTALVEAAARAEGRPVPRLLLRYPFLVGETPHDLPGLPELRAALERGAALVATADPIHHGAGYGTPPGERLAREDPSTAELARASVERGLELLARHDFAGFLRHAAAERSDFRDPGVVLATLLGESLEARVLALDLADYASTLEAEAPTWVAGALSLVRRAGRPPH